MKDRLDILLVKRGLAESREKAKAVIMSGIVYVDGQKEDKAGQTFADTANIEVRGSTLKYVSRGGLKLEKAMECFDVSVKDKVCMDIGASSGGFTDCMLQNGAKKVYSFISLSKVLPAAYNLLGERGEIVALIKPQFEAGREKVGKKGVVREKSTHIEVIQNCFAYAKENGFFVRELEFSPVKGPEGNIEYLYHLVKSGDVDSDIDIEAVVNTAHEKL